MDFLLSFICFLWGDAVEAPLAQNERCRGGEGRGRGREGVRARERERDILTGKNREGPTETRNSVGDKSA